MKNYGCANKGNRVIIKTLWNMKIADFHQTAPPRRKDIFRRGETLLESLWRNNERNGPTD